MTAHRFRPSPPNSKLTNELILECRALYELAGWTAPRLAEHYGLELEAVKRIATGRTGSKLFATVKHLPAGVEPLAVPRASK